MQFINIIYFLKMLYFIFYLLVGTRHDTHTTHSYTRTFIEIYVSVSKCSFYKEYCSR